MHNCTCSYRVLHIHFKYLTQHSRECWMDWFMLLFYAVALYALTVSGKDRAINDITNGGSVHRRKCESGERGWGGLNVHTVYGVVIGIHWFTRLNALCGSNGLHNKVSTWCICWVLCSTYTCDYVFDEKYPIIGTIILNCNEWKNKSIQRTYNKFITNNRTLLPDR